MTVVHAVIAVNLTIGLVISVMPGRTRLQDWEMRSRGSHRMMVYRSPRDFDCVHGLYDREGSCSRQNILGWTSEYKHAGLPVIWYVCTYSAHVCKNVSMCVCVSKNECVCGYASCVCIGLRS